MNNQSRLASTLASSLPTRAGGASLLAILSLALPAAASAGTPPSVTETFKSTGAEQTLTVPAGVTTVPVQPIWEVGEAGFPGGLVFQPAPGGDGSDVSGQMPVSPGEVLYVEVARRGFNGSADGVNGGGAGGDASDVRTVSRELEGTLESRLLVAAGGGGGGSTFQEGAGGRGGNAGSPGSEGLTSENFGRGGIEVGQGGGAGTLTGGGAAGDNCGLIAGAGTLGVGGIGGNGFTPFSGGGGGGGGYWGGGGGSGTCDFFGPEEGAGGGGGGGSSYAAEDVKDATFGLASASTEPSVTISYATPATATPEASTISFPGVQPQETVSAPQTITLTNTGGTPLQISSTTFAGSTPALESDHPEDFMIGSSSCLGKIAFEQTCQLTVRFAPQSPGTSTATLQIAGNMGAGPTTIALSGTGGSLPQGEAGAAGVSGKGTQGPAGPAGPQGERGPAGYPAVYECHPRQGDGKFKTACFVRVMSVSQSVMRATLKRGSTVYASGPANGTQHGKDLLLLATRHVPAGRYTLELISRHGLTSRYVTVK